MLIVFQTVCQGVGKGCEGASVRSLVDDDYKKPPPAKYGAAGTTPGVTGLHRPLVTLDD